jgi:hypothetical protein
LPTVVAEPELATAIRKPRRTAALPTVARNGSGFADCRCRAGACDRAREAEPELATAIRKPGT